MTATFNLGKDFTVKEDSNGNLIITHDTNGQILAYDAGTDAFITTKNLLTDGEDFDGQNTSDFSNLNSLSTGGATINQKLVAADSSKVVLGSVYGGHSDFATLQDAIDFAISNDYGQVLVPPGNFDPVDLPGGIRITGVASGLGAFSGTGDAVRDPVIESTTTRPAIQDIGSEGTAQNGITIENLQVLTSGNNGQDGILLNGQGRRFAVKNCRVSAEGQDIRLDIGQGIVCETTLDNLTLETGASNVTVTDNLSKGGNVSVTDNGSSNIVTDNQ